MWCPEMVKDFSKTHPSVNSMKIYCVSAACQALFWALRTEQAEVPAFKELVFYRWG